MTIDSPRWRLDPAEVRRRYDATTVLLTGHTGFKGAWLAFWLDRLGARVHGVALPPPERGAYHELGVGDRLVSEAVADVRDADAVDRVVAASEADVVFHLAAQPLVNVGWQDRRTTFASNVMGTVNVVEAALTSPATKAIVVATTDKVYANDERGIPFVESDRLGGDDPYAASKAAAELALVPYRNAANMGLAPRPITSVRAGNVIGGGDYTPGRLLPDIAAALAAGEPVVLRRPTAVRPWQHVIDCLWGYLVAGATTIDGTTVAPAYNLAPADGNRTVLDVARRAAAAWGADPMAVVEIEERHGDEEHLRLSLDPTKAVDELGWVSAFTVEDAVERTIESYRAPTSAKVEVAGAQLDEHRRRVTASA